MPAVRTMAVICLWSLTGALFAAERPTGSATPEGAACDAVLNYARSDADAWLATLIRPCYGRDGDGEYEKFKAEMRTKMERNKADPAWVAPRLVRCFKARELTKSGPASLGAALFDFTGNQFVDLEVEVTPGQLQTLRYHVIRDKDEKWYFEPRPDLARLLALGLNDEPESVQMIFEAK